ncbi:MAG TPA: inositol monophosphatase family protein [Acidimicrobiales bacterium]|nr:inositol monophosphatase family protein [Acidimicrobiales bacterium]
MATDPDTDGSTLLELAERVARRAGELLLAGAGDLRVDVRTKSSGTDMVSEMDRASEALVVEGILAERPDDAILGEEGASRSGTSGVRWVIDPLDGTTNYLYRHPTWAVSVAAEVDGRVEAGVVAAPGLRETFTAARGKGAWLNGAPIAVSGAAGLATALVGTGFGYLADRRARQAAVLPQLLPEVRDIRRNGVASLDLCWVACGRLDAYYEYGGQPWDVAAGLLVATEAGATAFGLDGGPPAPESVMVATPAVAGPLMVLLIRAGAALK